MGNGEKRIIIRTYTRIIQHTGGQHALDRSLSAEKRTGAELPLGEEECNLIGVVKPTAYRTD